MFHEPRLLRSALLFTLALENYPAQWALAVLMRRNCMEQNAAQMLKRAAVLGYVSIMPRIIETYPVSLEEPLRLAAREGQVAAVQYLLDRGANVDARETTRLRWAALQHAVYKGHLPVVQLLVEGGANVHALKECALRLAARRGDLVMIKYLIDHGANVHAQEEAALCWAAYEGHLPVVRYLVEEHKANISARSNLPVRAALYSLHLDVAHYLEQQAIIVPEVVGPPNHRRQIRAILDKIETWFNFY